MDRSREKIFTKHMRNCQIHWQKYKLIFQQDNNSTIRLAESKSPLAHCRRGSGEADTFKHHL